MFVIFSVSRKISDACPACLAVVLTKAEALAATKSLAKAEAQSKGQKPP